MSPAPPSPSPTSLKRKARSDDVEAEDHLSELRSPSPGHTDEYEKGFILCETCGEEVPIRDDNKNFTTKHWDAHRMAHSPSVAQDRPSKLVVFASENSVDTMSQPPAKRRRAKRTEEERIEYLRSDPYVSQFEPYRVRCASCDKWIRLRPNSTYCSIPWDAHRKSCLAKKVGNKNVYALEERNNLFSKDPDVRKFDAERLLCNTCDCWIILPSDDHLQAVQKWLQHRSTCQKPQQGPSSQSIPQSDSQTVDLPRRPSYTSDSPSPIPKVAAPHQSPPPQTMHPRLPPIAARSPSSFHAITPSTYTPAHESRRRSAEQRAANLRQDPYIAQVEPNRVFCKLCQKWVQLRQDSSYCAYPWTQHRSKCEARYFRRSQKSSSHPDARGARQSYPFSRSEEDELFSDQEGPHILRPLLIRHRSEDLDSEDEFERRREEHRYRSNDIRSPPYPHASSGLGRMRYSPRPSVVRDHPYASHHKSRSLHLPSSSGSKYTSSGSMSQAISSHHYRHDPRGSSSSALRSVVSRPGPSRRRSVDDTEVDADADGEPDGEVDEEGDYAHEELTGKLPRISAPPPRPTPRSPLLSSSKGIDAAERNARQPVSGGLADLDSSTGRNRFIFASVEYLFCTTYESTDDMSISALLSYLNAAMPPDKHEDFDTTEVVRAVAFLQERGKVVLEGDILRLVD